MLSCFKMQFFSYECGNASSSMIQSHWCFSFLWIAVFLLHCWSFSCRSVSDLAVLRKLALCHMFQTFFSPVCLPIDFNFFKCGYCPLFLFFFNKFILFYFWLHWVFVAARGLSLVGVSGGYSSLWCVGFSLRWLLLVRSTGSRHADFSSCGSRALECRLSSGARA